MVNRLALYRKKVSVQTNSYLLNDFHHDYVSFRPGSIADYRFSIDYAVCPRKVSNDTDLVLLDIIFCFKCWCSMDSYCVLGLHHRKVHWKVDGQTSI